MSKQLLAIDIDEVLAHHNRGLAEWHNQEYDTRHTADDYYTDYWSQVWNISSEEADKRANAFHASGTHARLQPVQGSELAIRQLKAHYELVIITVRRQNIIEDTRQWIELYYSGMFSDIHFLHSWDTQDKTTKAELCRRIGAQYLIDDSLRHCELASKEGIQAILFGDYTWNRSEKLIPGVKRANSWEDVVNMLV